MNTLNYFGTDTRQAGHYFWSFNATGQHIGHSELGFKSIPFNPEDFGREKTGSYPFYKTLRNGTVQFDKIGDYTILAITGSPIDRRPGCKSVFFIKLDITKDQIIQKINMTPAALKIISSMPFKVDGFKTLADVE